VQTENLHITEGEIGMAIPTRYRVTMLALTIVLAAGPLAAVLAKPAWADNTLCEGTLPPGDYDNVVVPEGTFCNLSDSFVRHNVTALEQSRLLMVHDEVDGNVHALEHAEVGIYDSDIRGNVKGHKANAVQVNGSIVGKNIHIVGANVPGPFGPIGAIVDGTRLPKGNIHIKKNTTPGVAVNRSTVEKGNVKVAENVVHSPSFAQGLQILDNQIVGNVQVSKNSGPSEKVVQSNDIRAALQCVENIDPFVGGPNFAQKAKGQCF
jgi:hypothetical protein